MEVDDIQTHQACKFSRVANGSKLDSSKLIHNHQHHHHLYPHDDDSHHNHQPHRTSTGITANNNNINTHINGLASAAEMGSAAAAGAPDETGGNGGGNSNRLRHLQHSNRIIRVSRASGGKDRHSKVWTAKGARDRRVRLSVTTAIQFYDLQDRLGFDQPSKAVEWLIKAAADAIAELPSLNGPFGTTDHHHPPGHGSALAAVLVTDVSDRRQLTADNSNNDNIGRGGCIDSADAELDDDEDETHNFRPHHHQGSLRSKSACSSTSETSKGSGLSLSRSRSEKRVQARERARERAAKDKEKENEPRVVNNVNVNVNPLSHGGSSFTQLLTAGIGMGNVDTTAAVTCSSPAAAAHHGSNGRQWPITSSAPMAMEYFNMLAMASSSSSSSSRGGGGGGGGSVNNNNNNGSNNNNNGNPNHSSPGFPGQIQLGNSMSQTMMVSPFTVAAGDHHHSELHQFPFVPDHLVQNTAAATGNDYNLNFSISPSGLAGFNRGTLQSNSSPSLYPQLQRFPALDGTSLPFFLGAAAAAPSAENQHHHHNHQHHQQQFPPGLQLCYRDGGRQQSDQKGKGKN